MTAKANSDIKVLLVDDHALFRAGLSALIEKISRVSVVGEAGSGADGLRLCGELRPDVMILDIDLPDIDGFEVTRRAHVEFPDVRIMVLTMYDLQEYAVRLLRLGAMGYLIKGASTSELPAAIKQVAEGRQYVTPAIREKIADMVIQTGAEGPLSVLTDREMQLLILVAQGESLRDIGSRLGLTFRTVETYYSRIKQKLGLRNSGDFVRFALKHNLIKKV